MIADSRFSLVMETKDDSKSRFEDAVGLATFSNSKPTVMPYVTIFESFWREIDPLRKSKTVEEGSLIRANLALYDCMFNLS